MVARFVEGNEEPFEGVVFKERKGKSFATERLVFRATIRIEGDADKTRREIFMKKEKKGISVEF